MKLIRNVWKFGGIDSPSIVTMGNFDGIHSGHQKLVEKVLEIAERENIVSVMLSYQKIRSTITNKLLFTYPEKRKMVEDYRFDYMITIPMTAKLKELAAKEFCLNILKHKLNARYIVIGYDHRFGRGREGNYELLSHFGHKNGIEVIRLEPLAINGEVVSSSLIKKFLAEGEIEKANRFLGKEFFIHGVVTDGEKRGRDIGFKTANLRVDKNKILPANGVYLGRVHLEKNIYRSVINIGTKPTFGMNEKTVEAHILDFEQDIYGKEIEVHLLEKIREELTFTGGDELARQIEKDIDYARSVI